MTLMNETRVKKTVLPPWSARTCVLAPLRGVVVEKVDLGTSTFRWIMYRLETESTSARTIPAPRGAS